ncbi:MAG: nuclear transport factor 2 family protein [Gaiellaceae bacterium]
MASVVALVACSGGEPPGPEEVVRAWSRALNSGDNGAAADLFAIGARIEQSGLELTVRTRADALAWNRSLPCSGRIVEIETSGEDATATFLLGNRGTSRCDAPGGRVAAVFRVQEGKIVLFRQLPDETAPLDPV